MHKYLSNTDRVSHAFSFAILLLTLQFTSIESSAASPVALQELDGLRYLEVLTAPNQLDEPLPMLIALHYMSGTPDTSKRDYANLNVPARLLLLEAPIEFEGGFSWFPDGYYELVPERQNELTASITQRVADFIKAAMIAYKTRGRPIVTGYSQGADIAYYLALHYPELVHAILPMGGRFEAPWLHNSRITAGAADESIEYISIFHGAADTIVDVDVAVTAVKYFVDNRKSVSFNSYAEVGHDYPLAMKKDYQNIANNLLHQLSRR